MCVNVLIALCFCDWLLFFFSLDLWGYILLYLISAVVHLNHCDFSSSVGECGCLIDQNKHSLIMCKCLLLFLSSAQSFIYLFSSASSHLHLLTLPIPPASPIPVLHPFLSFLLQSDVRKAHLRDCEHVTPSLPGQPVCVLPDSRACVFCDGVHSRRRPDDAHPHRCLHRATSRVCNICVCLCFRERMFFKMTFSGIQSSQQIS